MELTFDTYYKFAQNLSIKNGINIIEANNSETMYRKDFFGDKKISKKISFTPYIHNSCSAQCKFCSEGIERNNSSDNEFSITSNYFSKLDHILSELKDIDIFLSLSGMEPLESIDFLGLVLQSFDKHTRSGGHVNTKVIYSNLSAMVYNSGQIIDLVKKYKVDRIETSRHHYDEKKNQSIMNFRKGQNIQFNEQYISSIQQLLNNQIEVKMVCVLQKLGVNSIMDVEEYISWCKNIGIKEIVFRELSIIQDIQLTKNNISQYINKNRIEIYSIINDLPSNFKLEQIIKGYYYFSFNYTYNGCINVSFEVSDYAEMIKNHTGGTIKKLIYYPNGDLCMDWNMQQKIM